MDDIAGIFSARPAKLRLHCTYRASGNVSGATRFTYTVIAPGLAVSGIPYTVSFAVAVRAKVPMPLLLV